MTLELWRLRVVEVLISYGVALVLYRLLRRYAALASGAAILLAALFAWRLLAVVHGEPRRDCELLGETATPRRHARRRLDRRTTAGRARLRAHSSGATRHAGFATFAERESRRSATLEAVAASLERAIAAPVEPQMERDAASTRPEDAAGV